MLSLVEVESRPGDERPLAKAQGWGRCGLHPPRSRDGGVRAAGGGAWGWVRGLRLRGGGRRAVSADGGLLAAVALEVYLHRSLARDGSALGAGLEAVDVRTYGGDRCGADFQPAGGHRGRA